MRKRLKLSALIDAHNTLTNGWKFRSITKSDRRAEWVEYMDIRYPDLKPCPFCGGHPEFTPMHNGGFRHSHGAAIECGECDMIFKYGYRSDECIDKWNGDLIR